MSSALPCVKMMRFWLEFSRCCGRSAAPESRHHRGRAPAQVCWTAIRNGRAGRHRPDGCAHGRARADAGRRGRTPGEVSARCDIQDSRPCALLRFQQKSPARQSRRARCAPRPHSHGKALDRKKPLDAKRIAELPSCVVQATVSNRSWSCQRCTSLMAREWFLWYSSVTLPLNFSAPCARAPPA